MNKKHFLIVVLFLLFPAFGAAQTALLADENPSTAGYVVLSWATMSGQQFELQQSSSVDFTDVSVWQINGAKQFTHSGLVNGRYYFRVRADQGAWTEPLLLEVSHHSLAKAFVFFSAGFALFVLLVWIIFKSDSGR